MFYFIGNKMLQTKLEKYSNLKGLNFIKALILNKNLWRWLHKEKHVESHVFSGSPQIKFLMYSKKFRAIIPK